MTASLEMPPAMKSQLWSHLLPTGSWEEQAAFIFVESDVSNGGILLRAVEFELLGADDFAFQKSDYLELTDEARRRVIKRAHQSGLSLAEAHSHPSPWPAEFSLADRVGLESTVPHMLWRLPDRPYAAIVVSPDSYDGLVWTSDSDRPMALGHIVSGDRTLTATQRSIARW